VSNPGEAPALLYTEDEDELRTTVRKFLADRASWQAVLAFTEADPLIHQSTHPSPRRDDKVWRGLVEVGVPGLAVPESLGGAGASWREVAVVAEELGRAVAPTPFLGSTVLATAALLGVHAVGEADVAGTLGELAAGTQTAALAVPVSTAPSEGPFGTVTVAADGTLGGTVTSVADAATAGLLVVPAAGDAGPGLYLVEAADARIERFLTLDLTRGLANVTLEGAPAQRLAAGEPAAAALSGALVTGAAVLASEQLGVAERCLELTVEHLRSRYQFGRPLGSFQGLKHRLADLWVAIAQARATARYAADRVAEQDEDAAVAAAVAQAHGSPVAVRAAEECVQMHGGLGFTWEHPAHLYLKRARSDALALGTADRHRSRLGELVDLPPG
jgi:alkylation response protein AidB-like acyl-CoA dehydrogenase